GIFTDDNIEAAVSIVNTSFAIIFVFVSLEKILFDNISAIVSSIKEALEMPVEEQISRNRKMQEVLKRNHIGKWGNDMIKELLPISIKN
ncbi:MAG: hypothetical protein KBI07_02335, partial [Candidatus Atribacteria bacterium]|nr:hypothetical protein [Candidatus Atribacteria bacterium]